MKRLENSSFFGQYGISTNTTFFGISKKPEGVQKLSEYLPSMKLDNYSFELHQERVDK